MTEAVYRFAGHNVLIRSHFDFVQEMCSDYLAAGEPELIVEPTVAEIEREQIIADREYRLENRSPKVFTDAYLEHLAVYRKIAQWMITQDTFLLHGSVIAVDGKAYLFTAKSGTGKSTHTRLWQELFRERAVMVNDDKPLLIVGSNGVTVYGTPWNGKHRLGTNSSFPLAGIAILHRDSSNYIVPAGEQDAFSMLIQQSFRPEDPALLAKTLALLDQLRRIVPIWELHCNMDITAAKTAYEAMSNQKGIS